MKNTSLPRSLFAIATLSLFSLTNCFRQEETPQLSTESFSSYSLAWPSKQIGVCWLNPAPENEKFRQILRTAIKQEIEGKTIVSFSGFEACDAAKKEEIKIRFANEWPNSGGLGNLTQAVTMPLDYSGIKTADNKQAFAGCIGKEEFCTYTIGVHEVMHAIGFYHEQDRLDTPNDCAEKMKAQDYTPLRSGGYKSLVNTVLGPYDPESVMNYCSTVHSNGGKLTAQDIAGVNEIYKNSLDRPQPKPEQGNAKIKVQVFTSTNKIKTVFTNENEFPVRCNFVKLGFSANVYNRAIGGEFRDTITSNLDYGTLIIPARIRETRASDVPFKDYTGFTGATFYCGALNWNKGICQITSAWMETGFTCQKEVGF
jgi:Astacin (Peptidase family M12A)